MAFSSSRLTQTLVGVVGGRSPPWPVVVEGFADIAVVARRVMFAVTQQLSSAILHTLTGMTVTFTPVSTETQLFYLENIEHPFQ